MANPATGSAINFALGLERAGEIGVPEGSLLRYGVALPVTAGLVGEENDSPQINPEGFLRKGIPGAKAGPIEWAHPLTPGHLLEYYEHLFGKCTKTNPGSEAGVYQYVFEPDLENHVDTSFWGFLSTPPVGREIFYGAKFGEIESDIGDNEAILTRLKGGCMHGTLLGPAVAAAGNTGTYTGGPWMRGVVLNPAAGSIWIRATDDDPATVKVLQSLTEPDGAAWAAAATTFLLVYGADGNAIWQICQSSANNLDLGIHAENKDPLEFIFPGTATDHLDLVAADTYEFPMPGDWTDPSTTELTGYTRFTSAHWLTRFKAVGAATYDEKGVNTGKIRDLFAVAPNRGNLSRYAFDMFRRPPFRPEIELKRIFVDTFFRDRMDRHGRLAVQMLFEGAQIGTSGTYRESILSEYPAMSIKKRDSKAANANEIPETLTLVGETNDDGDPPCTRTVITARNWTPRTP